MTAFTGIPSEMDWHRFFQQVQQAVWSFILYLEFPPVQEWWTAAMTAQRDVVVASRSTTVFLTLSFRPLAKLLWFCFGWLWVVLQFLFKHLLSGVWQSVKKGTQQLIWATRQYYQWQIRQSRTVVLIELGILLTMVLLYLLRRHIQKQQYVERVRRWYYQRKRAILKKYQRFLDKLNQTSKLLAMAFPHAVFAGGSVVAKLLLGRGLTYLANETSLIWILHIGYPLLWTISLLHHHRHPQLLTASKASSSSTNIGHNNTKVPPSHAFQTPARGDRRRASSSSTNSATATPGVFPRTTPKRKSRRKSVEQWLRAAAQNVTTPLKGGRDNNGLDYDMDAEASYWWHYWITLAVLNTIGCMVYWTPMVGNFLSRNVWVAQSLEEMRLVIVIWLLFLPPSLTNAGSADPTKPYESRPIPLIYNKMMPVIHDVYRAVSNAIPETTWNVVCEKVKSVLQILAMTRWINEDTIGTLVEMLKTSRTVLPPAITLFMPGFVTSYGVLYVSNVIPASKQASCVVLSTNIRMQHLEYWVLWVLFTGFFKWWAPILWWIPFSTHAIFLWWCYVQLGHRPYYDLLEEELMVFGLLTASDPVKNKGVENTLTLRVWKTVVASLPSADMDGDAKDSGDSNSPVDETSPPTPSQVEEDAPPVASATEASSAAAAPVESVTESAPARGASSKKEGSRVAQLAKMIETRPIANAVVEPQQKAGDVSRDDGNNLDKDDEEFTIEGTESTSQPAVVRRSERIRRKTVH